MTGRCYVIRQQDKNTAVAFIDSQIDKDPKWLGLVETRRAIAEQEYRAAQADSTSLNAWCRKWLNETHWGQIKNAINSAREQKEQLKRIEPHRTISLTHQAWQILSDLARQEGISLSEVIVNRLGKEWMTIFVHADARYDNTPLNRRARS
ncbi:MAG TPA: hypothetical protein PK580_04470 [Nitrosomonas halophila]|nr:hypothetical protein [Nitrosomonas halophila]